MVWAKIRIKLITHEKEGTPTSVNYLKLKDCDNECISNRIIEPNNFNGYNISDFFRTANEYWSKIKECLRKSTIFTLVHTGRKCTSWVSGVTVQLSEKDIKPRMWGEADCPMFRRFAAKEVKQRGKNHYWSELILRMETATRLGDNKKQFRFLHKATTTRGTISEMVSDSNGLLITSIKDCIIGRKKFFETKHDHKVCLI